MQTGTITVWATGRLADALSGLELCDGVVTEWTGEAWASGEVSVTERKGRQYPVYALEAQLPWNGMIDGTPCHGLIHLPDISVEMLDELEVKVETVDGNEPDLVEASGVVQGAVRAWAAGIRKAVASASSDELEWDPSSPSPHSSDRDNAQEEEEEQQPYTEMEVLRLMETARQLLGQKFSSEDAEEQFIELQAEVAEKELQEKGRVLIDVIAYLQNGEEPTDEQVRTEPYVGPDQLEELWSVVAEMCNGEDLRMLEEAMRTKPPQEQWNVLLDVRDHLLNGDKDEQEAFEGWEPTRDELETEWLGLLQHVPAEDLDEVQRNWAEADADGKKSIVWDVRSYVKEQEAERVAEAEAEAAENDDGMGRSELRRRGATRAGGDADEGEEEEDVRRRGSKRARSRGSCWLTASTLGIAALCGAAALFLTAKALAQGSESMWASLARILSVD
jgi:hypothetical protein